MASPPPTVAIYGSCVSRDTFEACAPPTTTLHRYIARHSLIAAFNPPAELEVDYTQLPSRFQRKMLKGDLRRRLNRVLTSMSQRADLLMWDLVDERLGVYEIHPNTYVTRSIELITSGMDDHLAHTARHIPFGTDEHFELWATQLQVFVHTLKQHNFLEKTRLIAIPWAERDQHGNPTPESFGITAKKANKLYKRYYRQAADLVPTCWISQRPKPRADATHKWGPAPFHYHTRTYQDIATAVGLTP